MTESLITNHESWILESRILESRESSDRGSRGRIPSMFECE